MFHLTFGYVVKSYKNKIFNTFSKDKINYVKDNMRSEIKNYNDNVELKRLSNILKEKIKILLDFSKWLDDKLKNQKDDVSAACNDFLKVLGYVALGFSWLKMTKVSFDNSSKNKNFYEEKINTAKYFFDKILPRIDSHYHSAIAGSESLMKAKFN